MRIKSILMCLLASLALAVTAQPTQQTPEWEWYLGDVVSETFVGRNYFEYYYTPSAADMAQQREKGEVTYFLNSPEGLNSKKVRDKIDQLMSSYDDIRAVGEWHMTNTTYWKEFRFEKNKFRFSVKRKALDDGTYYVSATETAGYYKSLGNKEKQQSEAKPKSRSTKKDKSSRRSTRDRKPVVIPDEEPSNTADTDPLNEEVGEVEMELPVMSAKEQRKLEAQQREAEKRELRAKQRREQEKQRAEAKAKKKAEEIKKAEDKKKRQEEERLKQEEKKRLREQERLREREEREARRQEQEASKRQTTQTPKQATPAESHFHHDDVALWLSEKYDFTQTAATDNGCTMFSTAVKDAEMAKLAIKNALKGSNARMAVPWRVNGDTQALETGYTVDGHVLIFTIGKDEQERVTLTITEVSGEQFELFKQGMGL